MIFDAVIQALGSVITWLIEHFPAPTVPTWLDQIPGKVSSVTGYASSLSAWFPVGLLGTVLTAWATAYGIAVGIKLVRMIASFLTGGGGSVA